MIRMACAELLPLTVRTTACTHATGTSFFVACKMCRALTRLGGLAGPEGPGRSAVLATDAAASVSLLRPLPVPVPMQRRRSQSPTDAGPAPVAGAQVTSELEMEWISPAGAVPLSAVHMT